MQRNFPVRRRIALVLLIAVSPAVAMAYIDPGNGAYMVQLLFTLAATAIFYLKHPIRTIKTAWRWMVDRNREPDAEDAPLSNPLKASEDGRSHTDPAETSR